MHTLWIQLMDWWRGYTDADVDSLQTKWRDAQDKPAGSVVRLTPGEDKALRAGVDVWGKTKRPSWTITLTMHAEVRRNEA